MNNSTPYRENCLLWLRNFILEPTNEHKLELYLAYETGEEESLEAGLRAIFEKILYENAHSDAYLAELKKEFIV
jgi:hypothetical protein